MVVLSGRSLARTSHNWFRVAVRAACSRRMRDSRSSSMRQYMLMSHSLSSRPHRWRCGKRRICCRYHHICDMEEPFAKRKSGLQPRPPRGNQSG
eukprot:9469331-Pyramimonas_sp.AAC.2